MIELNKIRILWRYIFRGILLYSVILTDHSLHSGMSNEQIAKIRHQQLHAQHKGKNKG